MSTANFSSPNLSCVYAIGMNSYDYNEIKKDISECNEIPLDEISDDQINSYISDCLSEDYENSRHEIEREIDKTDFTLIDDKYLSRDRTAIAQLYIPYYDKEYSQWEDLIIYVTIESGYYEGAKFDIEIDTEFPFNKTTQKKIDRAINTIEKILSNHCLKLRKAYQFSNGEAGYEIIK